MHNLKKKTFFFKKSLQELKNTFEGERTYGKTEKPTPIIFWSIKKAYPVVLIMQ